MRFDTLQQWLTWQEGLHPWDIELGLERIHTVWRRLAGDDPLVQSCVITVAGTNGKGSCVAMLDAILRAAGYRTGVYTSPHLLRYNERIRIDGEEVADAQLCDAFSRIDHARGEISLTYFEFGTLAALELFRQTQPDVILLEVGLGGRLDAVNIIDADVALLTSVGIDHVEWLGEEREAIGREKAGIFRNGRAAVCGDPAPPVSVLSEADRLGAKLYCLGREFGYARQQQGWQWWAGERLRSALPFPALAGEIQLQNAASVLMVLELLRDRLPVNQEDIRRGLQEVKLQGRFQVMPGAVTLILDVTHNADGARVLARNLRAHACKGSTLAVVSMLQDKDVEQVGVELQGVVDRWYVAGLQVARGQTAAVLAQRLRAGVAGLQQGTDPVTLVECETVAEACGRALQEAQEGDRIVVFGSFYTVTEGLCHCV